MVLQCATERRGQLFRDAVADALPPPKNIDLRQDAVLDARVGALPEHVRSKPLTCRMQNPNGCWEYTDQDSSCTAMWNPVTGLVDAIDYSAPTQSN